MNTSKNQSSLLPFPGLPGTLHDPLQQSEGFCELCMWQNAWDVLDGLPDELRAHPAVLSRRLDVLVGLKHWEKALILGTSLARVIPKDPSIWFRLACIHAQLGDMTAAKGAIAKCRNRYRINVAKL